MSASMRPTRAPRPCRARARLVATVDLPTPPLPLATATTCRMFGREIFRGGPPWGCIGVSSSGGPALGALAQLAQVLQRVDAGVVAVAPDDLVGVAADRGHRHRLQRHQLLRFQDAEGVRRFLPLLAAAGAGAVVAQVLPGVDAAVAVVP